ncbi:MAG: hypothetical protein P8X70_02635, partial [Nanoarchaeota archaeon]
MKAVSARTTAGLNLGAKMIASAELKRKATSSDYIGYIFLLWFSPIGIWFIQPKVQKIINE